MVPPEQLLPYVWSSVTVDIRTGTRRNCSHYHVRNSHCCRVVAPSLWCSNELPRNSVIISPPMIDLPITNGTSLMHVQNNVSCLKLASYKRNLVSAHCGAVRFQRRRCWCDRCP